jgi:hypothetical protein
MAVPTLRHYNLNGHRFHGDPIGDGEEAIQEAIGNDQSGATVTP